MDIMLLAVLTAVCGAAAIGLWSKLSSERDALQKASKELEESRAEVRKQADRASAMQRKLDKQGQQRGERQQALDKAREQAKDLRSELDRAQKQRATLESELQSTSRDTRRLQRRLDELEGMLAVRGPAPQPDAEAEPQEAPSQEQSNPPAEPSPWEEERLAKTVELERLKTERFKAKQERLAAEEREEIAALRVERETYLEEVFKRERALRASQRKERDNHRAYIITKGQLDLALDELYRIKHGTERPTLTVDDVVAAEQSDDGESAETQATEVKDKPKRRRASRTKKKPGTRKGEKAGKVDEATAPPDDDVQDAPVSSSADELKAAPPEADSAPQSMEAATGDIVEGAASSAETDAQEASSDPSAS